MNTDIGNIISTIFPVYMFDLPPVVVPIFKLGRSSGQARDPSSVMFRPDLWESALWPQVAVLLFWNDVGNTSVISCPGPFHQRIQRD